MNTAKKRQAFEVIAEIEQKWRKRFGVIMWAWSFEHVSFLTLRWQWKNPGGHDRIMFFLDLIAESLDRRKDSGLPSHWLYMHKDHIRELMQGAGLNTSEPEYVSKVTDFSVIELPKRQMVCVG